MSDPQRPAVRRAVVDGMTHYFVGDGPFWAARADGSMARIDSAPVMEELEMDCG